MDISTVLLTLCVAAFTATAALIDWRTRKLPNWLNVSCLVGALVFHFAVGLLSPEGGIWVALDRLMWALLGFATGFSILFVLWAIGQGGGGDVKLMGALGAWLMPQMTLFVFIGTYVLVLLLILFLLAWSLLTGQWGKITKEASKRRGKKKKADVRKRPWQRVIPYGVSVALATWLILAVYLVRGKQFPYSPAMTAPTHEATTDDIIE